MTTVPIIDGSVPGAVVYIGTAKNVRVTPNGFEQLGSDGKWYLVSALPVPTDSDDAPTLSVSQSTTPALDPQPAAPSFVYLGSDWRINNLTQQMQSKNQDTGQWHNVTVAGSPAALVVDESGEP